MPSNYDESCQGPSTEKACRDKYREISVCYYRIKNGWLVSANPKANYPSSSCCNSEYAPDWESAKLLADRLVEEVHEQFKDEFDSYAVS